MIVTLPLSPRPKLVVASCHMSFSHNHSYDLHNNYQHVVWYQALAWCTHYCYMFYLIRVSKMCSKKSFNKLNWPMVMMLRADVSFCDYHWTYFVIRVNNIYFICCILFVFLNFVGCFFYEEYVSWLFFCSTYYSSSEWPNVLDAFSINYILLL